MAPLSPPSRYRLAIWPALDEVIMTALATKPSARYQNVTAFAAALTRAGELASTGASTDATVMGTAGSPVPAAKRFAQSKASPETPDAIPEASTIPLIDVVRPAGSARSPAAWWRAQSSWGRWFAIAGAIALLAITLLSGVSLYAFGSPHPGPSTGAPSAGVPAATVTAISAALATAIAQQTPGAAATATALATQATGPTVAARPTTPSQPTSTSQPTATAVPGAPLQINPMPLVLTPTQADPEICRATQRITNIATTVVGWAWQNTQGGLHFQLNGQPVTPPPSDAGMASGGQDTLTITADCTAPSQSTSIAVKDTLGNPYTFELTVQ
jgi:hypothetical protein